MTTTRIDRIASRACTIVRSIRAQLMAASGRHADPDAYPSERDRDDLDLDVARRYAADAADLDEDDAVLTVARQLGTDITVIRSDLGRAP